MKLCNITDKNSISLDDVCYLISETITRDEYMVEIKTPTEKLCYCSEKGVFSSEFFDAAKQGFKAEKMILINTEEFSDELKVKFDGKVFDIYRNFPRADGYLELYLNYKAGE